MLEAQGGLMVEEQLDFSAGLITTYGKLRVPSNGAFRLQNAMVHLGGFQNIYGTTKLNPTKIGDKQITSQYRAYSGAISILLATAGIDMYYWTGTTFTSIKTGLTEGYPWCFACINSMVYATNGVDDPFRIIISATPTVSAMVGPPVKCKQFIVAKNRLYAAVNDTNPDRMYYCDKDITTGLAKPEVWNVDWWQAFPYAGSNEKIITIKSWKDNPVVMTENTVSILFGDNDTEFSINTTEYSKGCRAMMSCVNFGDYLIYLGRKGFYAWAGGASVLISRDIQPEIDNINQNYIGNVVAVADEEAYYCSYTSVATSSTVNDRTLMFDGRIGRAIEGFLRGGWTGPHTIGAASFSYWSGKNDKKEIYYGDATSTGFIHKFMDSTSQTFSGNNIERIVETGAIAFQDFKRLQDRAQLIEHTLIAEIEGNYNEIIKYALDGASTFLTLKTISVNTSGASLGDSNDTTVTRNIVIYPSKFESDTNPTIACNFCQLQFYRSETGGAGVVRGYNISASKID